MKYIHMEMGSEDQCPARKGCPLGAVCGTAGEPHGRPLYPVASQVEKGELLWTNLRFENHIHVIQSGAFVSIGHTEQGREIPFALLGRGIAIGVAELYLTGELSDTYHIRNLLPGKVCSFSTNAVRQKLEATPEACMQELISSTLTNQCTSAFTQTRILSQPSLYHRILTLLLYLRDITGRTGQEDSEFNLTHEEIGTLVSSDRVSTTRVLHKMRDDEIIELGYRSITLCVDKLIEQDQTYRAHTPLVMAGAGPRMSSKGTCSTFLTQESEELYAAL